MSLKNKQVKYIPSSYLDRLARLCLFMKNITLINLIIIVGTLCLLAQPVTADLAGQRLILRLEAKLRTARSIAGIVQTMDENGVQIQFDFKVLKPNLYAIISKSREIHCDGSAIYDYSPQDQRYTREPLKSNSLGELNLLEPFQSFVVSSPSHLKRVRGFHREWFDGKLCNKISILQSNNTQEVFYLDSQTDLPCGYRRTKIDLAGRKAEVIRIYRNVRLNITAAPEEFTWESPQGTYVWVPTCLKVGEPAPLFMLKTTAGRKVELATVLRHSKAVILNFWFCGCGPCRREFSYLEKLYHYLRAQGLAVLTVNIQDPPEKVSKYFTDEQLDFEDLVDQQGDNSVQRKYSIVGTPYTFVIGPDRTIVDEIYGFDDPRLSKISRALAKLGISKLEGIH
jgi:peroxiredoxin/outer membrane lipoprotein-sorting protein